MQEPKNPKRTKIAFIVTLIIGVLLLIGSGGLGYLYYQKTNDYNSLKKQNEELKKASTTTKDEQEKQIDELKKENETLKTDKANLEKQVTEKDTQIATAAAYNDFFKYLNQVIRTHNGVSGWTDAEYQVGHQKAEATGSQDFANLIEWAWYHTEVDPITRLLEVWDAIANGIEGG